jgi:hypothetical protein
MYRLKRKKLSTTTKIIVKMKKRTTKKKRYQLRGFLQQYHPRRDLLCGFQRGKKNCRSSWRRCVRQPQRRSVPELNWSRSSTY